VISAGQRLTRFLRAITGVDKMLALMSCRAVICGRVTHEYKRRASSALGVFSRRAHSAEAILHLG